MADEEKPVPAEKIRAQDVPAQEDAAVTEITADAPEAGPPPGPAYPEEPAPVAGIHREGKARRSGFVAPFLGGAVAAAIGFGLSHYNVFNLRADIDSDAVTASLVRLDSESKAAAEAGKAASDKADAALSAIEAGDAGTREAVAALTARVEGFEAQLKAQAEALPDGSIPPAAFAALKAEVEALKAAPSAAPDGDALRKQIEAELDARAAEVAAEAERDAEATRQAAQRDAAWISLNEAVKNGQPYADALTALGLADVPAPLASHAADGLPGLAQLAESFPEAARNALDQSLRADEAGGFGDRALSLLRVTTGQRSLTPQEGADPDAVLSRAEAAVKAGDLPAALAELQALPPEGVAAMEAWTAQAQARIDAEAALAALKP